MAGALVVAGRLLGSTELFVLGAVAGALVLGAALFTGLVRLRVDVARELHPPRVHAGSPSRVDLRVENLGTRRSPVLNLRDEVSGTRGAELTVGPLPPGGVARAAYRLPTDRRGVLRIGPLSVVFGDPFGFTRLVMPASGTSELTVYPHVDEVPPIPQTTGNDPLAGAEHPNALGRTGEDFYALRHYVVGDDLRRVHWPATARHDELMVRQDELPWQGRATVVLDVRSSTHTAESLEVAVSAAASLVTASARREDLIRLVGSDGTDSGFAAGQSHIEAILEYLAGVEASPDLTYPRVLDRLSRGQTGGALVAVLGAAPPEDVESLLRLRRRFGSVVVLPVHPSAGDPSIPAPEAGATAGVHPITSSTPFPSTWTDLVGARGGRRMARRVPVATDEDQGDEDRWALHARLLP